MKSLNLKSTLAASAVPQTTPRRFASFGSLSTGLWHPIVKVALCILAGGLLSLSKASAQAVYAMEFNQGNNLFGTISLLDGSFTALGSEGGTLFNDIAATPGGTLYGIVSSSTLVTLNTANGAVVDSVNFSVSGIESLALSPDGTLYGASQTALYTIDPSSGDVSLVGSFDNSLLNNAGQNIRFNLDGNLYDTDGGGSSQNTDLFQISLTTGAASTIGVIDNVPGLCLANAGQMMYGVGIQLGSASTPVPELIGIDLNTIASGGTNADGSLASLPVEVVDKTFPNNYNLSGQTTYIAPSVSAVPEPSALGLSMAAGVMLLVAMRRQPRQD